MNIKNTIRILMMKVTKLFPIKKKKILFFSYYGEHYSGSPRYLSEYFSKNSDFEIVWAFTNPKKYNNLSYAKIVRYGSPKFFIDFATSKIIVTNYRLPKELKKKKNQIYIQTWHSSLRLKMIEKDAQDTLTDNYKKMAIEDSKQIDLLLAGSKKSKEIFERAFWYEGEIIESGTPQCDTLFNEMKNNLNQVRTYFNLEKDVHIALYAPTFRKNHSLDVYNIDYKQLIVKLEKTFGGKWVLLLRLHPHLINLIDNISYSDNVLPATEYDDPQELLSASEILISDYSAIMFDYALTKKPCFLYTPDLEEYKNNDRGFYFEIEQMPFSVAKSNNQLMENIEKFDSKEYQEKLEDFLFSEVVTYEDGHACERVLKEVNKRLKG